jgi:hypothetical protein
MIFHHHCEVCGAEAYRDVKLRVLYVGFCGSAVTTHYLCGYHSRELESAMYRMKKSH